MRLGDNHHGLWCWLRQRSTGCGVKDLWTTINHHSPKKPHLENLPIELQYEIIKHLIPGVTRPRLRLQHLGYIGIDESVQMGTTGLCQLGTDASTFQVVNTDTRNHPTGIAAGSLNIACVSKHYYMIAIHVLYHDRCFEVGWGIPCNMKVQVPANLSIQSSSLRLV